MVSSYCKIPTKDVDDMLCPGSGITATCQDLCLVSVGWASSAPGQSSHLSHLGLAHVRLLVLGSGTGSCAARGPVSAGGVLNPDMLEVLDCPSEMHLLAGCVCVRMCSVHVWEGRGECWRVRVTDRCPVCAPVEQVACVFASSSSSQFTTGGGGGPQGKEGAGM